MISVYIIFGTVALLGIVSITLTVYAMIRSGRISSALAGLEKEIEKKELEFDTIRKERSAQPVTSVFATEPAEETTQQVAVEQGDSSDIQIVRNVRGSFGSGSQPHMEQQNVGPYAASIEPAPAPQPSPAIRENVVHASGPTKPPAPAVRQQAVAQPAAGEDDGVMAVVADAAPAPPPLPQASVVRVYSEEKKDADFEQVSRHLSEQFRINTRPTVALDFTNVMFLYDKELAYLEKIGSYVNARKAPLYFINCEPDLLAVLNQRPSLSRHIYDSNSGRRVTP